MLIIYTFSKNLKMKKYSSPKDHGSDSSKNEPSFYAELNTLADNLVEKINSGKIEEGLVKEQKQFYGIRLVES